MACDYSSTPCSTIAPLQSRSRVRRGFIRVPARLEDFPPLDAVLLSHDHYDHLGSKTVRKLAAMQTPFVTSLGVGGRLEKLGVDPSQVTELDWWESQALAGGALTLTATPAQHFSGRGLFDRNETLWSSWVIQSSRRRLFFSGDTGLAEDLTAIGEKFRPFDLTMIEIGASNPAWADIHLGPEKALRAFEMLGGGTLLPIHWSTFDLGLHHWKQPAEAIVSLAAAAGVRVITPPLGRAIEPDLIEEVTPWWEDIE